MNRSGKEVQGTGLIGWIMRHRWLTTILVLLALLILAIALLDQAAKNRVRHQLDRIRASQEPLTIEEIRAAMPVIPDDENRYIALMKCTADHALIEVPEDKLDQVPEGVWEHIPYFGSAKAPGTGQHIPPEQLNAVRWYLGQFQNEIKCVHDALKMNRGSPPVTLTSPVIEILLPHLMSQRETAKLLAIEVILAREENDIDRAVETIENIFRLDEGQSFNIFLISVLAQMSNQNLAYEQIERTINHGKLDDEALKTLQRLIRDAESAIDMKQAMIVERVTFIDTMECVRSGRLSLASIASGASASSGLLRFVPGIPALDAAKGLAIYTSMVDSVGDPDIQTIRRFQAISNQGGNLSWYCIMTKMLTPSFTRAVTLWVRWVARNRALQTALACERYRLRNDDWPSDPTVLVPEYLDAIPMDPFDKKPIRYKRFDRGITIWSIGDDETDDVGKVNRLEPSMYHEHLETADVGWVLLNPEWRGRPANEVSENTLKVSP